MAGRAWMTAFKLGRKLHNTPGKQYLIAKRNVHLTRQTWKASPATIIGNVATEDVPRTRDNLVYDDPAYAKIDLSFENAKEAFRSKTNWEIIRALLVFNMCSINYFVSHNKQLMKIMRGLLGKNLFERVMKSSFYGQFVAGEDEIRIGPTVQRNRQYGVKSILDYSVEKDISKEQAEEAEMESSTTDSLPEETKDTDKFRPHREFGDRREHVTSARTYFYEDEAHCDANMDFFIKGIDAVSGATSSTGFSAVKLTALGRPQFLLLLSEVLNNVRRHFNVLAKKSGSSSVIDLSEFESHLKTINLDKEERRKWFTILDSTKDGEIDLLDWHNMLEVNVSLAKLFQIPGQNGSMITVLSDIELEQMRNMLRRVDTIIKYGAERDVRVMIDAEQTYFQPAINRLCMEMMRIYNKDKAMVFNTYQCYLKDAYNLITTDMALAKREDFYFGAKLVRGAYMDQERMRAASIGYEDPINPTYDATTAMYKKVLVEVFEQIQHRERGKISLMVASHNEDTVRYTVEKMREYNIKATDRLICFGQLFGMCDQVSFSLGQAGYSVYKYVPYGPVEEVLPYLSRRAEENKGILTKVKKEKRLLWSELWRRFKNFQFIYRPQPAPSTN